MTNTKPKLESQLQELGVDVQLDQNGFVKKFAENWPDEAIKKMA